MFFFPALMTSQNKAKVRECLKPLDNFNFGVIVHIDFFKALDH